MFERDELLWWALVFFAAALLVVGVLWCPVGWFQ
jgi:hypothetical protein